MNSPMNSPVSDTKAEPKGVCIIPAKGHSRRCPRKNARLFHGKPMLVWSIETAKASGLFEHIVVSTDDREIMEIAESEGVKVMRRLPFWNDLGTQELAAEILTHLSVPLTTMGCVVYATAPMLLTTDLEAAWEKLTPETSFVYACAENPERDPGQFYMGWSWAFRSLQPLLSMASDRVMIPEDRVCDINTEDDWVRAEEMFAAMRERALA